nr:CP19k-like protein 3 [Chthamalus malayensis]
MLLRFTLLLCVALAVAVPTPSKKGDKDDKSGLTTSSEVSQSGITQGGGVVSSKGSSKGSTKSSSSFKAPDVKIKRNLRASSGVSGSGASSGDSAFGQKAGSKSVVSIDKDEIIVRTGTKGKGFSTGDAGAIQSAGATAGGKQSTIIKLPGGKKLPTIIDSSKGAAKSSSGHDASTAGEGTFKTINIGGTEVRLDDLSPDLDIEVKSKQGQAGRTTRGGNVNSHGSTQGSADSKSGFKAGKKVTNRNNAAVNAGAAAQAASTDNGAFRQNAKSFSGAKTDKDGISVRTGNIGEGNTRGHSGVQQKTGANAGANKKQAIIITLPDGKKTVRIVDSGKGSAQSSSGQEASSTGKGSFRALNVGGTDVKLNGVKPGIDLSIESRQKQAGVTSKGGAVSSQGKSRGAGSDRFKLKAVDLKLTEKGAGNAGTSAQAHSAGNGAFKQDAKAKTDIKSNKDGLTVATETGGRGKTAGDTQIAQGTAANGKADQKKDSRQKYPVKSKHSEQGSASSSSGHDASSSDHGSFQTKNKGKTTIKSGDVKVSPKKG